MTATTTDTLTVIGPEADAKDRARWQWEREGFRVLRILEVTQSPHPGRWRVTAELEWVR